MLRFIECGNDNGDILNRLKGGMMESPARYDEVADQQPEKMVVFEKLQPVDLLNQSLGLLPIAHGEGE